MMFLPRNTARFFFIFPNYKSSHVLKLFLAELAAAPGAAGLRNGAQEGRRKPAPFSVPEQAGLTWGFRQLLALTLH